jgi:DNA-binding MarR family transcriptional regulator
MNKQQYIEQLVGTMSQLRKLIESQTQESHADKVATIMQFSTLKFLKQTQNCTVGTLAENLSLSKSSATQLIERLEKTGLVERVNDREDRRVVHVSITPAGEEYITVLKKKYMDRMGKIFSKIPDSDLKELIRIHTQLIETLQKELSK